VVRERRAWARCLLNRGAGSFYHAVTGKYLIADPAGFPGIPSAPLKSSPGAKPILRCLVPVLLVKGADESKKGVCSSEHVCHFLQGM
jgi:hypothetical protein